MRLEVVLKNARRLPADERGVVMYYTAIVAFFILALFSLCYDVARVSEVKMQMQNAADAAALEMAVWQARGMNLVQNMNDEIYNIDTGIYSAYVIAAAFSVAGNALEGTGIVGAIGIALEAAGGGIAGFARLLHIGAVEWFLVPVRDFYAHGAGIIGYISANNAAAANGADQIIDASVENPWSSDGLPKSLIDMVGFSEKNFLANFKAVGVPVPLEGTLMLPLVRNTEERFPLHIDDVSQWAINVALSTNKFVRLLNPLLTIVDRLPRTEGPWFWPPDPYYESSDESLVPMLWIVNKKNVSKGLISTYFLPGEGPKLPVIACAAAQARGRKVVIRTLSPRRGAHANAVLAPVGSALKELGIGGDLSNFILH